MPALLDALQKCTADLQQYWNMDKKTAPRLKNDARGDLRSIFSPNDYPTEAIAKSQGGTVQYQLLVDESGAVAGCDVRVQSGVPILDVVGCEVIKQKLKFSPAIDMNGKPVRTVVTTPPIVWRMSGSFFG